MKITFFTPGLGIGGIERVFLNYADKLSTLGYKIDYLTCYKPAELSQNINKEIRLFNLNTGDLKLSLIPLMKYLISNKPDYIVTANTVTIIVLFAKLLCFSRVKIIASHHSYENCETSGIFDRILWKFYNYCYKVIAVSNGIKELLISKGVKKKKIEKIYNPVNLDNVVSLSNKTSFKLPYEQNIVFVGRLVEVKNVKMLIRCISNLENEKIGLVIIGDGPEKQYLEKLVKDLGMNKRILFLGAVSNPYPLIKQADIIALSSTSEAFPMVMLEGLVLGRIIVSTPTQGALEISRNGKLCYISSDFSDESFCKTIISAIDDNMKIKDIVQSEALRLYSPDNSISCFVKLLR